MYSVKLVSGELKVSKIEFGVPLITLADIGVPTPLLIEKSATSMGDKIGSLKFTLISVAELA